LSCAHYHLHLKYIARRLANAHQVLQNFPLVQPVPRKTFKNQKYKPETSRQIRDTQVQQKIGKVVCSSAHQLPVHSPTPNTSSLNVASSSDDIVVPLFLFFNELCNGVRLRV
jgi:hypothetical protein